MTDDRPPAILITGNPVDAPTLKRLTAYWFGDMVKLVIDVERRIVAIGGELHADAEALLLEQGSRQADVWGANDFPGVGPERCLELTALINIRPGQGNRGMVIQDTAIAAKMRTIVSDLIGHGEAL